MNCLVYQIECQVCNIFNVEWIIKFCSFNDDIIGSCIDNQIHDIILWSCIYVVFMIEDIEMKTIYNLELTQVGKKNWENWERLKVM